MTVWGVGMFLKFCVVSVVHIWPGNWLNLGPIWYNTRPK